MEVENIRLSNDGSFCVAIDQTRLPGELACVELRRAPQFYDAIRRLVVRGAPCIGIAAAFGIACEARALACELSDEPASSQRTLFDQRVRAAAAYLAGARPTAVNLSWALARMLAVLDASPQADVCELVGLLAEEARAIQDEDVRSCRAIAEQGLALLHEGCGVLTHCNAGPLATSAYGTALGPVLLAHERGMALRVFADETRPLLQGARLTAWELARAGVDVTLICDNMAADVMSRGWVDAVLVGCDRVAANGDVANKVGTLGVAVLARHFGIPFYVLGPTSTIDLDCPSGEAIAIEQRDPAEISHLWYARPMAPAGVPCHNPSFDVTPHHLVTAIVTERGIVRPPFGQGLRALFGDAQKAGEVRP